MITYKEWSYIKSKIPYMEWEHIVKRVYNRNYVGSRELILLYNKLSDFSSDVEMDEEIREIAVEGLILNISRHIQAIEN